MDHALACAGPPPPTEQTRGTQSPSLGAEEGGLPGAQAWASVGPERSQSCASKPRKQTPLADVEVRSSLWTWFSGSRARENTDPP